MAHYKIKLENHGPYVGLLNNPHGTFTMQVPGEDERTKPIPLAQLKNMQEVIAAIEVKQLPNNDPEFTVTILDPNNDPIDFADLPRGDAGPGIFVPLDYGGQ